MRFQGEDLRCYCRDHPLLARCGVDQDTGEPVIHLKYGKGERPHLEAVVVSGIVRLKCRACGRWHRVKINRGVPRLQEQPGDPILLKE